MELDVGFPARLFNGETGDVVLTVTNRGAVSLPWLTVQHGAPFDLHPGSFRMATALAPGETRSESFPLVGSRRGIYQLGPSVMVSGDVFGWHPAQRSESARQRVVVYPRIVPLAQLGLPARSPFPSLPTPIPLFEDPNRLIGVRAYQFGDSARRIHWPASAHQGELLVRKLQPAWGRDTVVLLDTSKDSLSGLRQGTLELSVTAAASILYHVVANEGQPAGLRIPGMTLSPSSGQNHLMAMLEVLAAVGVAGSSDDLSQPHGLPFGATLVLVTGILHQRWSHDLLQLQQRGFRPSVLLTSSAFDDALAPPGIRVRTIAHQSQLDEALA